jgi:site-specific DNA-methyltransferase (adenine-specific)
MKTELVKVDTLVFDPANARKHGEKNLSAIKSSLQRFGQQKPIVVDANGVVRAGNGTLAAAKALGWKEIAIVRSPLSGSEATAYAIADNRTSELAEWDDDVLSQTLAALQIEDEELALASGFDAKEIDALLAPDEVTEDEAPEPPVDPITKHGDLWLLGEHRLLCGDSTKADDFARLMHKQTADATISDPPYGLGYEYATHDDSDNNANASLVASAFALGSNFIVWTPGQQNLARDINRFGKSKVLIWFKKFASMGNGLGGASVWEPILVVGKPPKRDLKTDVIECMTDRLEVDGKPLRSLHTCPKPVALYARLIESFTDLGQLIYEPFCGSGTTLIAAEQLGRKCYGMEISPQYCDVIVKRWENLTGKKAVLATR